nr:uncharacterized protein LOC115268540 [Aedes albopictus]
MPNHSPVTPTMNDPGKPSVPTGLLLLLLTTTLPSLIIGQNLFGLSPQLSGIGKKKLVVHRVGQCPGQKNLPIFVPDMRVAPYNATNMAVSGVIEFREDFPNGWDVSATVKKCDDFRSSASCRPYLNNIANSDQCMLLRIGGEMMWMKYLNSISPKAICPFRKGNYTYGETLVDDDWSSMYDAGYMPGSGTTYWEVEINGKVKNQLVLCIIVQLNVRPKKGST